MNPSLKGRVKSIIESYNEAGPIWKQEGTFHSGKHHLEKRKKRNEIPQDWTLNDYNGLILNTMNNMGNDVHLYYLQRFTQNYFTIDDGNWIVVVGEDGIMETAMWSKRSSNYLASEKGYTYLGKVKELFE